MTDKQLVVFECGACGHSAVHLPARLLQVGVEPTTPVREIAPRARCEECDERSYKTRVTICSKLPEGRLAWTEVKRETSVTEEDKAIIEKMKSAGGKGVKIFDLLEGVNFAMGKAALLRMKEKGDLIEDADGLWWAAPKK